MKNILLTRFLHWKKQMISLIFWLILPAILTAVIIQITSHIQDDTKVPVGLVLQDDSEMAASLVDELESSPLVRVSVLEEDDALFQLKKHKLDSVFIIPDGYANQIRKGSRNRLITGYESDLSIAYSPVKERLLSFVQQDTARSKAAYRVQQISKEYDTGLDWTWDEIVDKSIDIQSDQDLIKMTFSFFGEESPSSEADFELLNLWGLWSIFALLSTLLLFDWVIKETRTSVIQRFAFMKTSLSRYLLGNTLLYFAVFLLTDLITLFSFHFLFEEVISWNLLYSLIIYRCILTGGAFLFVNMFRNMYIFYSSSFIITLFAAIISGAIIPIDGVTNRIAWLDYFNPVQGFLSGKPSYSSLLLLLVWGVIWFVRKEKNHA